MSSMGVGNVVVFSGEGYRLVYHCDEFDSRECILDTWFADTHGDV